MLTRPLAAGGLLLVLYASLALLMDPGGYLGTDTGAKVATLEVMDQRGTAEPALGYWAERFDPEGDLHPIYDALPVDGDWVHVTTLPMLELARPLYAVGGYRLTLLLPMLGAVGTAFAARAIARRAASDDVGWLTFWIVGLASPITIYALDFWEHAPGVACIVGAVAVLGGILEGRPFVQRALLAGVLLGIAGTLRTESFVYALVAVGACLWFLLVRDRRVPDAIATGALAVVGFALPWIANAALEDWLGGTDRGSRVSGAARSGASDLGDRAREAVITLLSLGSGEVERVLLVGGLAVAAVGGAVAAARRGSPAMGRILLIAVAALHVATIANGLGFVPGMLAAAPLAVVGTTTWSRSPRIAYPLAVALGALPLVWAFQFVGGALPQWGGRYILASCILLVALGVVGLSALDRSVQMGMVALSVLVTASGVLWLAERSREFDRFFEELVDRPEDVIVVRNGFLIREGGAAYTERLWLTAVSEDDLEQAAEVVAAADHDTFAVLDESPEAPPELGEAGLVGTDATSVVGVPLYLHTYELAG